MESNSGKKEREAPRKEWRKGSALTGNEWCSGNTQRETSSRLRLRERRNVKEGILEEVIAKPKGRERIRREGNAVPGKMKSTCKGPEARGGRFTTVGAQKSPEDIIFI